MHEKIELNYIAKIEGHASFLADIIKGEVEKARIKIEEGARLIEGILRNRKFEELPEISSRICGVCPTVHYLTSLKAIESALGVKISPGALLLRKLMMASQIISSHTLHLFFFSLSDFFAIESDLDLIKKYPTETSWAVKIRDTANKITKTIGGRVTHPLTPTVGGFRKLPDRKELEILKDVCLKTLPVAENFAKLFAKLTYPEYKRKTDHICLIDSKEYAVYGGRIKGLTSKSFLEKIKEVQLPESVVKRTFYNNSYMVGALPRIEASHHLLNPLSQKIFTESGMQKHFSNPFYNILAQAIEVVHFLEEALKLIDEVLKKGIKEDNQEFSLKEGKGMGAIEAPRGTLFYDISMDKNGIITDLNIITPTVQNLANLEKDLEDFEKLKGWKKLDKKQKQKKIAMLIRAYDPCVTCATH